MTGACEPQTTVATVATSPHQLHSLPCRLRMRVAIMGSIMIITD
eukprot:COSAG01_NODE_2041_length_8568_cov_5.033180_13_plen_44_part_00